MVAFTKQEDEDNARLQRETETALRESDKTIAALTDRVVQLEVMDTWIRFELYPWLITLAVAIPFANPPTLPD